MKGISPDVVTYSTLMKAYTWAKKFDEVHSLCLTRLSHLVCGLCIQVVYLHIMFHSIPSYEGIKLHHYSCRLFYFSF